MNQDGLNRNVLDLLAMPDVNWSGVCQLWPQLRSIQPDVVEALEAESLYAGYIRRQEIEVEALRKENALAIPLEINYRAMPSLSAELRQKLDLVRPTTLGQASRIDGMTPAALAVVLGHIRRRDRQSVA